MSCFKCGYTQMFMLDMKVTPTALNTLTGVWIYSFRKIVNLLGIEIEDIYIIMLCFIANCLLSSLKKNILATKLKKISQNFQCFFFYSLNGMFREAWGSVMPICNMIPLCTIGPIGRLTWLKAWSRVEKDLKHARLTIYPQQMWKTRGILTTIL